MKKSEVRKLYKVFKRYDFFNDCAIMAKKYAEQLNNEEN